MMFKKVFHTVFVSFLRVDQEIVYSQLMYATENLSKEVIAGSSPLFLNESKQSIY